MMICENSGCNWVDAETYKRKQTPQSVKTKLHDELSHPRVNVNANKNAREHMGRQ
jgi:hypothetical protein